MTDPRQFAPSAQRNRDAIRAVLAARWPKAGIVLEIASGSGEHAVHLAAAAPHLTFQPTDPLPAARASIDAWSRESGLPNLRPALDLDVMAPAWPAIRASMMLCINMIHIAPWAATPALMRGAAACLDPGAVLWLYGPFRRTGVETAEGNLNFDAWLKDKDPRFGVRHLDDVAHAAAAEGLGAPEVVEMPANNCLIGFRAIR